MAGRTTEPSPRYEIRHIDTPEGRALLRSLSAWMPHLPVTIAYVSARQKENASAVAWYARERAERSFFRIPSPLTGCMIHSGRPFPTPEGRSVFPFPDAPGFALLADSPGQDAALNAVLTTIPPAALLFETRAPSLAPEEIATMLDRLPTP